MLYNHLKLGRPSHAAARLAGGSSGAGAGRPRAAPWTACPEHRPSICAPLFSTPGTPGYCCCSMFVVTIVVQLDILVSQDDESRQERSGCHIKAEVKHRGAGER